MVPWDCRNCREVCHWKLTSNVNIEDAIKEATEKLKACSAIFFVVTFQPGDEFDCHPFNLPRKIFSPLSKGKNNSLFRLSVATGVRTPPPTYEYKFSLVTFRIDFFNYSRTYHSSKHKFWKHPEDPSTRVGFISKSLQLSLYPSPTNAFFQYRNLLWWSPCWIFEYCFSLLFVDQSASDLCNMSQIVM